MQSNPHPISPPRLNWFPVHPSWIVATGLSIIAVLPHQTPYYIFQILRSRIGALMFVAFTGFVFWKNPVLGMAMAIFLISLQMNSYVENFSTNISKDPIKTKNRWYQEEVMMEDPHTIQERTESPGIVVDEVSDDTHTWFSEKAMNETPISIQERPVGSSYPQQSTQYEQTSSHK